MALRCEFCQKGVQYGHAVSHAKNRTRRIFKPNLQKLKVLKNGVSVRVKFCTSCIKRLKKDGSLGIFTLRKFTPVVASVTLPKKITRPEITSKKEPKVIKKIEKKEEKARETLNIEAIVGKKS